MFWLNHLREMLRKEVFITLFSRLESKYPNLVHLFELLLVFPVSNAKVERGFSGMGHLMCISTEGPSFLPCQEDLMYNRMEGNVDMTRLTNDIIM